MTILLDTNVLVDVFQHRDPFYASALELISRIEAGEARGAVSAISYNNAYYVLRRSIGRGKAMAALRLISDTFATIAIDDDLIRQAIGLGLADFEDAIQHLCARRAGADYIATRNAEDFPESPPALTPDELLVILSQSQPE